ncbi:hypothetical protein ACRALDRAFT_1069296 [Sodiomyces alcalophilus JCM 7366]|uniref:uncharacterized protein n=1 Tax=Sodiomyces alcalophilus JCM 7366 TaxID=591952 RepID=UPI0039B3D14A
MVMIAFKKNDTAAKKAAPVKKGAIKTGRVTKPAKKNTYKAAKEAATTAAADTADTAATPEASSSTAKAPKKRFSAKNPPPGFMGEEFENPYTGYVKGWIAGHNKFDHYVITYSITKRCHKYFSNGYKCLPYTSVIAPIIPRAVIAEKELVKKPDNTGN